MAVRKKLTHDAKTRERIKTSQIINRLVDHIDGKVELSSTQIRAAEIILKKTLPDLTSIEMTAEITRSEREMTDAELADIASGGRTGAINKKDGKGQVH